MAAILELFKIVSSGPNFYGYQRSHKEVNILLSTKFGTCIRKGNTFRSYQPHYIPRCSYDRLRYNNVIVWHYGLDLNYQVIMSEHDNIMSDYVNFNLN